MDIESLIASFSTGTYVVIRTLSPTPTRGRYDVGGVTSTFNITASVSPLSGNDLKSLPEGSLAKEVKLCITSTPLQVGGQGQPYECDTVQIDGESWQVVKVERWIHPGAGASGVAGYKCFVEALR